jgi:hypothetical protein
VDDDLSKYVELTSPKLAIALIGRALTHRLAQNYAESIKDLDKAIIVDPENIQGFEFKKQVLQDIRDTLRLRQFLSGLDAKTLDKLRNYESQKAVK